MFSISLFLFWQTNSIRFTVRFLLMISIYYVSTSLINKKRRIYKFFYSIEKLSDVDFLLVFCFWHYNKVLLFIGFYYFRGKELKLKNARNSSRILESNVLPNKTKCFSHLTLKFGCPFTIISLVFMLYIGTLYNLNIGAEGIEDLKRPFHTLFYQI